MSKKFQISAASVTSATKMAKAATGRHPGFSSETTIGPRQTAVLAFLAGQKSQQASNPTIQAFFDVSQGHVVNTIASLRRRGLVSTRSKPGHGQDRSSTTLTAAGRRVIDKMGGCRVAGDFGIVACGVPRCQD